MDDGDGQDIYLVENIVDRRVRRGKVEYRVRWKGFPPDQDSWEPFNSLKESCLALIQQFHYRKMLHNKRRFSVPVSTSQRLRLNRVTSNARQVSSEPDAKESEDTLVDGSVSSTRSQQPFRSSKRNAEDKLTVPTTCRSTTPTANSNVAYTGSISVNPSCLIPADSMEKAMHFTSESSAINRLDPVYARVSIDSEASTISNSTTSSSKARRSLKKGTPRTNSSSKPGSLEAKANGMLITNLKADGNTNASKVTTNHNISRPAKSPQRGSSQSRSAKSAQPNKFSHDPVPENGVPETGRKSVTIMLKASPTHEFHSTKALQTQQHANTSSAHSRSQSVKKSNDGITVQSRHSTKSTDNNLSSKENVSQESPSDSTLAKVMSVIHQLRVLRRRPAQVSVIDLSQRRHGLSRNEALSALSFLVSEGQLHEVIFANGISYRLEPGTARGDLNRPTTLSAKIKAKYVSKIKRRKGTTYTASTVPSGSKRSAPSRRSHVSSNKRLKTSTTATNSVSGTQAHGPWSNPASQSWPEYQSTFGRVLKPTSVRTLTFRQSSRDSFFSSQVSDAPGSDRSNFAAAAAKPNCTPEVTFDVLHDSSCNPTQALQSRGSRIFVVPPASPLRDSNVEIRFNSLPHRRTNQALSSFDITPEVVDRSDLLNRDGELPILAANLSVPLVDTSASSAVPPNGTSRRSSTRQTEITYKFKSILVRKNAEGGFTEVWLQSPGSLLKNAFTIQVLEELTTVLNQAVFDTTRLVMICGMGTVFSAGIDLTAITGPLPDRSCTASSSHRHFCFGYSSVGDIPTTSMTQSHSFCCPPQHSVTTGTNSKAVHSNPLPCVNSPSNRSVVSSDQSVCHRLNSALRTFLLTLVAFPKLVVVGVNGPAMGLAVAMLPLCDLVYISDSATFQIPYTKLCQTPEGGSSFTLAALIGLPLANELLLTGRKLSAREALQRGLASDLLYPKCFKEEMVLRCRKLASFSPMALEMTKCIIRMQHRERIEYVINMECRKLLEMWQTLEFRNSAVEFLLRDMGDFL